MHRSNCCHYEICMEPLPALQIAWMTDKSGEHTFESHQKFHYYGIVPTVHRIEKLLQMENNSLSGEEVFWLYRDGNEIVRNEIEDC